MRTLLNIATVSYNDRKVILYPYFKSDTTQCDFRIIMSELDKHYPINHQKN